MSKIRAKIYIEKPNDDALEILYFQYQGMDYQYGDHFFKFIGEESELQELLNDCKRLGLKLKQQDHT